MLNLVNVLAYLDPGTGSLIAQFLIAGIISATAVFSGSIARFKRYFTGTSGQATATPQHLPRLAAETTSTEVAPRRRAA